MKKLVSIGMLIIGLTMIGGSFLRPAKADQQRLPAAVVLATEVFYKDGAPSYMGVWISSSSKNAPSIAYGAETAEVLAQLMEQGFQITIQDGGYTALRH